MVPRQQLPTGCSVSLTLDLSGTLRPVRGRYDQSGEVAFSYQKPTLLGEEQDYQAKYYQLQYTFDQYTLSISPQAIYKIPLKSDFGIFLGAGISLNF